MSMQKELQLKSYGWSLENRSKRFVTATLVALVFLFLRFWPLLFGKTLLFGDNYSLMVPGKLLLAEWLRQGVLPLWNPYALGGLSLVGDINQSLWYPSTVLFTIFSPATALNLTVLSHELIAFLGMFGLSWYWLGLMASERNQKILSASTKTAEILQVTKKTSCFDIQNRFWLACIAGVLWMFSPQVSGAINNIATIQSIVWLPAVIWAGMWLQTALTLRQMWVRVGVVAAVLTIQLAGGYPQHVLFSGAAAVFVSLLIIKSRHELRRSGVSWVLVVVLLFGISALWWLPFRETLSESTRTLQSSAQAGAGSLHPADLIKLIAPYFFDNPVMGMKWGPQWNSMPNVSLYVGWLPLVMIVIVLLYMKLSRIDVVLFGGVIGTILFAFGDRFPLLQALQELSSIFRFSRGPSTILMVSTALLILWVVSHLQQFQALLIATTKTQPRSTKASTIQRLRSLALYWFLRYASWLWGGLAILMAFGFYLIWQYPDWWWQTIIQLSRGTVIHSLFHTSAKDQVIGMSITGNLAINAGLLWLGWQTLKRKSWPGLLVILALDLLINTHGLFFFAPKRVYPTTNELRQNSAYVLAQQVPMGDRVLIRNYNAPYTDFGAYWEALAVRAPFSDSYITAEEMQNYQHLQRLALGLTPAWNVPVGVSSITGYTTLMPIALNQAFGNQAHVAINNLPPISLSHPGLAQWGVGYYLVDTAFQVSEDLTQLRLLDQQAQWQLYALPTQPSRFQWLDGTRVRVENFQETPNELNFEVIVPASQSALVVADRYDSGWVAEINGIETAIFEYDGRRKVIINPGRQKVVMRYQPSSMRRGAVISATSIIIWLFGCIWLRLRRRDT